MTAAQVAKVSMMSDLGDFLYADLGETQVLEMPYTAGNLAMTIILPKKVKGLAAVENSLNAKALAENLLKLRRQRVDVRIPKFRITFEIGLAEVLKAMGMRLAFTPQANFSGIATATDSLELTSVIHKAYVDVDEQGTEAAAATGITFGLTSAVVGKTPEFHADHPFLFLIRDKSTGLVLFMGRLSHPSE